MRTGLGGRRALGPLGAVVVVAVLGAWGCVWGGGGAGGTAARGDADAGADGPTELAPPGYGTLRQDQVTLSLRRDDLLIKVTPLAEGVIRLTAPDTYDRLRSLKTAHGPALARSTGLPEPPLFLVSFFSYEPNVLFQPEDVHLVNRGLRLRPREIAPVTPGWGIQRLAQEETQMAIYAFDPEIDLEQELAVEYQDARRGGWDRILQTLQSERARVRARARSDPQQPR